MNIIHNFVFLLLFLCSFVLDKPVRLQQPSSLTEVHPTQAKENDEAGQLMFRSSDGGQTWQDISEGLPADLQGNVIGGDGSPAVNTRVYLRGGNGIYHSEPNADHPAWKKAVFLSLDQQGSIAPGKAGIYAYNFGGQLFQQKNGTDAWFPVYRDFERRAVRFVFETAGGIVFIGSNNRLFKSGNKGKSWKLLPTGGLVMKMVESNGTLLATGTAGILRSSDEGETWNWVIKDGGVGIDVASFNGGFAAISFSTLSNTRRIRASYDAGITWQAIDAGLPQESSIAPPAKALFQINRNDSAWHPMDSGLPPNAFISSIVKAGEQFFCGHPAGIFNSSDKGKTWKLILPSVKGKIFHLSVVGNVIYAIPANAGC